MTEKLLQAVWQFQYFDRTDLKTTDGESVTIIFPGKSNSNQGPDFLNAKVRLGNTLLVGSVELHLKTSGWRQHGHSRDANYNNVVLHVVLEHDELFENGMPVLALGGRIPKLLLDRYALLMQKAPFIPCAATVAQTRALTWMGWKERLVAERLTRKAETVFAQLQKTGGHWEETFWRLLARNFGVTLNADAFEELAQTVSITTLAKQRSSIPQLEALLLGQANLLNDEAKDEYTRLLQREYRFLKTKYTLTPITNPVHFLRMRPSNFPTVRLAQLAMLVHNATHLFSKLLEEDALATVKTGLQVTASDYWHTHYRPGHASPHKPKNLGSAMTDTLIINAIVPVLFAYGLHHRQEGHQEKAIRWLQELAAENNSITTSFAKLDVANRSAYDSQALLELKNNYCDARRCLQCAIGNALLKSCL